MSPAIEADFNDYLNTLARKRGLWVLTMRELLESAFLAGCTKRG